MTVGSVGTAGALASSLRANGLSAAKIKIVQNDVASATRASGGSASPQQVRTALDRRISADVASGKISVADAIAVTKSLDQTDQQASTAAGDATAPTTESAAGTASPSGGVKGGGGGGGGGGGSAKTELSRTVTVAGGMATTTIVYTDGTSTTAITAATQADLQKAKKSEAAPDDAATAQTYLAGVTPGSFIDTTA
jgi:hypothetical protein